MKLQWAPNEKGHLTATHESGFEGYIHVRDPGDVYRTYKYNVTVHAPEGSARNGVGRSHTHGTNDLDEAKRTAERKVGEMLHRRQVRAEAGALAPVKEDHMAANGQSEQPGRMLTQDEHAAAAAHHRDAAARATNPSEKQAHEVADRQHREAAWAMIRVARGRTKLSQFAQEASKRADAETSRAAETATHHSGGQPKLANEMQHTNPGYPHYPPGTASADARTAKIPASDPFHKAAMEHLATGSAPGAIDKEHHAPMTWQEHIKTRDDHKTAAKAAMNPSERDAHLAAADAHERAAGEAAGNRPAGAPSNYRAAADAAHEASKHAEWQTNTRKSVTEAFVHGAQGKPNTSGGPGTAEAHQLGLAQKRGFETAHPSNVPNLPARQQGSTATAQAASNKPHEDLARQLQQGKRGGTFHISKGGHKIYHSK